MKRGVRKLILSKLAQQNQDIRRLPGAKAYLFGGISWMHINKIMNELNINLSQLGKQQGKDVNFQTVLHKPSSIFTGSLKPLFELSLYLWKIVIADRKNIPYSADEAENIANTMLNKVSTSTFPDKGTDKVKYNLVNYINNWLSVLKNV